MGPGIITPDNEITATLNRSGSIKAPFLPKNFRNIVAYQSLQCLQRIVGGIYQRRVKERLEFTTLMNYTLY
jgi:hypothetical protein